MLGPRDGYIDGYVVGSEEGGAVCKDDESELGDLVSTSMILPRKLEMIFSYAVATLLLLRANSEISDRRSYSKSCPFRLLGGEEGNVATVETSSSCVPPFLAPVDISNSKASRKSFIFIVNQFGTNAGNNELLILLLLLLRGNFLTITKK